MLRTKTLNRDAEFNELIDQLEAVDAACFRLEIRIAELKYQESLAPESGTPLSADLSQNYALNAAEILVPSATNQQSPHTVSNEQSESLSESTNASLECETAAALDPMRNDAGPSLRSSAWHQAEGIRENKSTHAKRALVSPTSTAQVADGLTREQPRPPTVSVKRIRAVTVYPLRRRKNQTPRAVTFEHDETRS